jgi:hypothetical protein
MDLGQPPKDKLPESQALTSTQAINTPTDTQNQPPEDESIKGRRLVDKDNILKLIFLFVFTAAYGTAVGLFHLEPRSSVEGYLSAILLIFSSYIIVAIPALIYKTIVLLWAFAIVGYRFKEKWIIFVPIVAYELTAQGGILSSFQKVINLDFFHYLALHHLSYDKAGEYAYDLTFFIPFAYILAFVLVLGIRYATFLNTNRWKSGLIASILLLIVIPVGALIVTNKVGPPLYAAEQKRQDAVYIPATDDMFGTGREIVYAPMQHKAGFYQNSDDISYESIFPTTMRSTEKSCKGSAQKTKSGITYKSYTQTRYKSNGSEGLKGKYTDYNYCFVIGSYKYNLSRSDGFDGPAYLQKYTIDEVIDATHSGTPLVYSCAKYLVNPYEARYGGNSLADYCDDATLSQANDIRQTARDRWTIVCEGGNYGDNLEPTCEQIINKAGGQ